MRMTNVLLTTVGWIMTLLAGISPALSQPDTSTAAFYTNLDRLIDQVRRNNPQLKAQNYRVDVAATAVIKSLDPPLVGFELFQAPVASFPNPFKDQMEYDYSIQQMFPFPGKLSAMAGAEKKRVEMLTTDRQTKEQEIIRAVKASYYEIYLLDRRMGINRETRALVGTFVDIARKQYELGMGKQSDLLRAQTELTSLDKDSIILIQQRKSMEGMINAYCARPVSTGIGFIPEIDPGQSVYDLNTLLITAGKNRPELQSMQTAIAMVQAERSAARKEYLPDFMVRGMYKQMVMGPDYWSLMAGVTVPVAPWSLKKTSSLIMRADANISAAEADLENMKNMIAAEVNDALQKVLSATERLKLSRETAIPQAQQALAGAMSAYKTGKEEFLMLIDIERMLVMAKLDYHMAVMTLLESESQLERAIGMSPDKIDTTIERGKP
jgi:cobalt-zinc-cadmium efflux system outer membrane protein